MELVVPCSSYLAQAGSKNSAHQCLIFVPESHSMAVVKQVIQGLCPSIIQFKLWDVEFLGWSTLAILLVNGETSRTGLLSVALNAIPLDTFQAGFSNLGFT